MPFLAVAFAGISIWGLLSSAIISFVGNFVIGALTQALSKKPQSFTPTLKDRTVTVRQPITPWQIIYGQARVGGVYVFIHTTGSSNNVLHGIIVLACHTVQSIDTIYFGSDEVPLDTSGNATGKYAGFVTIKKHLGDPSQAADADLIAAAPDKWTSAHQLRGRAYLYVQLTFSQNLFPSLPNISAVVKGKPLYDPRSATTVWSANPVLAIRDYLTTPASSYGVGAAATEIDDDLIQAEANICDEQVITVVAQDTFTIGPSDSFTATPSSTFTTRHGGESDHYDTVTVAQAFTLNSDALALVTGDPVVLAGSGLPSGVSAGTIYYAIRRYSTQNNDSNDQHRPTLQLATSLVNAQAGTAITITTTGSGTITRIDQLVLGGTTLARINTGDKVQVSTAGSLPAPLAALTDYYWIRIAAGKGRLAASLSDALAGTAIVLTTLGSGIQTIFRNSETRYTCNGVLDSSNKPSDVLGSLLSSCAGKAVRSGALWRIFVAAWRAPTVSLDESDARGPIKVQSLVSRRDLFNGVKGVYISPANFDQPTDFPPYPDPAHPELDVYLGQDGGERIWRDIELTYTNSPSMAQRLSKVVLEQVRQQITVQFPAKLTAWGVTVPDVISLSSIRFGWVDKPFETVGWTFSLTPGSDGAPVPGIDLVLRETASAVFDWNSGLETLSDPAPNTTLPNPFTVASPGTPSVAESLYATQSGAGVKSRATVSWGASPDAFVVNYQLEYKLASDTTYTVLPQTSATTQDINDVASGTYQFHVRAFNTLGIASDFSPSVIKEIQGLMARPADMTGFSVTALGGQAHCRWDRSLDLDVLIGGYIRLRWAPVTSGAAWANGMDLGPQIAGSATEAAVPLVAGSYMAKFVDSTGNESLNAITAIITAADLLGIAVVQTVTENPTFGGTKTGVSVVSSALQLNAATLSGTYNFTAKIDLGFVFTFRLTANIAASVFAIGDLLDSRTDLIDAWESFDGTSVVDAVAGCRLEVRTTQTDPAGSPTWTDWQSFVVGDYTARGIDLRLILYTTDLTYNINVTGLVVTVSLPQRTYDVQALSVVALGTTITHSPRFWQTPSITVNITNAASGDYPVWSAVSASAATLIIKNAANTAVARTVDLIVKGLGAGT